MHLGRDEVMARRATYKGGKQIEADPKLDWAGNLAHMMGAQLIHHVLCALSSVAMLLSYFVGCLTGTHIATSNQASNTMPTRACSLLPDSFQQEL